MFTSAIQSARAIPGVHKLVLPEGSIAQGPKDSANERKTDFGSKLGGVQLYSESGATDNRQFGAGSKVEMNPHLAASIINKLIEASPSGPNFLVISDGTRQGRTEVALPRSPIDLTARAEDLMKIRAVRGIMGGISIECPVEGDGASATIHFGNRSISVVPDLTKRVSFEKIQGYKRYDEKGVELPTENYGFRPQKFDLTDRTAASIVNFVAEKSAHIKGPKELVVEHEGITYSANLPDSAFKFDAKSLEQAAKHPSVRLLQKFRFTMEKEGTMPTEASLPGAVIEVRSKTGNP